MKKIALTIKNYSISTFKNVLVLLVLILLMSPVFSQQTYEFTPYDGHRWEIIETLEKHRLPESCNQIKVENYESYQFLEDEIFQTWGYKCVIQDQNGDKITGCYKKIKDFWIDCTIYIFDTPFIWKTSYNDGGYAFQGRRTRQDEIVVYVLFIYNGYEVTKLTGKDFRTSIVSPFFLQTRKQWDSRLSLGARYQATGLKALDAKTVITK